MKNGCFFLILVLGFLSSTAQIQLDSINKAHSKVSFIEKLQTKQGQLIGQKFLIINNTTSAAKSIYGEIKNKVTLINFWFASCLPCIREFSSLNNLYEEMKKYPQFELVALTFETPQRINEIKKSYSLKFKIISISKEECNKLLQGFGYPTNLLVDKSGTIRYWKSGGEIEKEKIKQKIKNIISQE